MGEAHKTDMQWWWSRDEERFHGPCAGRAAAIMEAWSEDPDCGAYICQATQGPWHTDLFEANDIAERFDDANDEVSDPDGDPPSSMIADEKWKTLAERLNRVVRAAIRNEGILAWGFTEQSGCEFVDIRTAWAAAEAIASKLAEEAS